MPSEIFAQKSVFVENLPYEFTDKDLAGTFSAFAPVKAAHVFLDKEGLSRGVGYVTFPLVSDMLGATSAIAKTPLVVAGRRLRVTPYKDSLQKRAEPKPNAAATAAAAAARPFHPAEFEPRPDHVLFYNVPEPLANLKELREYVGKVYSYISSITLHSVSVKDWHQGADNAGLCVTYALIRLMTLDDFLKNKNFREELAEKHKRKLLDPERVAANLYKCVKKDFEAMKADIFVRPYDCHAVPKATTLIVRNIPFTASVGDLAAGLGRQRPFVELRLPGKNLNRSGTGFAFLVLAFHADCAALVQGGTLNVCGRRCVVDWSFNKDAYEEQMRKAEDAPAAQEPVALSGAHAEDGAGAGGLEDSGSDRLEELRPLSRDESYSEGTEGSEGPSEASASEFDREPAIEVYDAPKGLATLAESAGPAGPAASSTQDSEESADAEQSADTLVGSGSEGDASFRDLDDEESRGPRRHDARDAQDALSALEPEAKAKTKTADDIDSKDRRQDDMECTLFVTNLPPKVHSDRLREAESALAAKARARDPEADIDPHLVLIAGLRFELRRLFKAFGRVSHITVVTNRYSGRPSGSAFVQFASKDAVTRVLEYCNSLRSVAEAHGAHGAVREPVSAGTREGTSNDPGARSHEATREAAQRGQKAARPPPEAPRSSDALKLLEIGSARDDPMIQRALRDAQAAEAAEAASAAARDAPTPGHREEPEPSASGGGGGGGATLAGVVEQKQGVYQSIVDACRVPPEFVNRAAGTLEVNSFPLSIKPAVTRDHLGVLLQHRADAGKDADPRNTALARVGLMVPGAKDFDRAAVPPEDLRRRILSWSRLKKLLRNPNMHVSPTRVCIRNIPDDVDELRIARIVARSLGRVNESAVQASFDRAAPAYEHRVAMALLRKVGCTEVRMPRGRSGYNLARSLDSVYTDEGYGEGGRHSGYCFAEFKSHEAALRCLLALNNNARAFSRDRRPIVEFAVENARKMFNKQQRDQRQERGRQHQPQHQRGGPQEDPQERGPRGRHGQQGSPREHRDRRGREERPRGRGQDQDQGRRQASHRKSDRPPARRGDGSRPLRAAEARGRRPSSFAPALAKAKKGPSPSAARKNRERVEKRYGVRPAGKA